MTYGYSALEVEKSTIISVQFAATGMICMFLNFSFTYLKSLGLSIIEKLKSPILYFEAYILQFKRIALFYNFGCTVK